MNLNEMSTHLALVSDAHTNHPKTPEKAYRRFDGITPFVIRPIWCATTIVTESTLPMVTRTLGFYTLLYHDVLEDTNILLPDDLSEDVKNAVREMTFANTSEEMKKIWKCSPEIKLFKFYDKVSNIFNLEGWPISKIEKYLEYTDDLAAASFEEFGMLNIHFIYNGLHNKYQINKWEIPKSHISPNRRKYDEYSKEYNADYSSDEEWPNGDMSEV